MGAAVQKEESAANEEDAPGLGESYVSAASSIAVPRTFSGSLDGTTFEREYDFSYCKQGNPANFVTPAEPMSLGGGTADIFDLQETDGSRGFWIGKDIERAVQEVEFYHALTELTEKSDPYRQLKRFMVDYGGVCKLKCQLRADKIEERQLILLRNMSHGHHGMRLFDVKIGEVTAVPGWQGKSGFSAWCNNQKDQITNSSRQGMRLEGVVNPAPALKSRIDMHGKLSGKRGKRIYLQTLRMHEILHHWLDLKVTCGPSAEERVEAVLWDTVCRVVDLCQALRNLNVPQQWIGSSIALVTDDNAGLDLRLFDWGRSELSSPDLHFNVMNADERMTRLKYWQFYCRSMSRLLYETARMYTHRFLSPRWSCVVVGVWDLGAHSEALVGLTVLDLADVDGAVQTSLKVPLSRSVDKGMRDQWKGLGELRVSITKSFISYNSATSWQIHVIGVENLSSTRRVIGDSKTTATVIAFADNEDGESYVRSLLGVGGKPVFTSMVTWSVTAAVPVSSGSVKWDEKFTFLSWPDDAPHEGTFESEGRPLERERRIRALLEKVGTLPLHVESIDNEVLEWFPVSPAACPQMETQERDTLLEIHFPWVFHGKIPGKFLDPYHSCHSSFVDHAEPS